MEICASPRYLNAYTIQEPTCYAILSASCPARLSRGADGQLSTPEIRPLIFTRRNRPLHRGLCARLDRCRRNGTRPVCRSGGYEPVGRCSLLPTIRERFGAMGGRADARVYTG